MRSFYRCCLVICFIVSSVAHAELETFEGVATTKEGKPFFTEKHETTLKDRKVVRAKTTYLDPNGKVLAVIDSDFEKSLTSPQYTFEDLRLNERNGVRLVENQYVMFSKEKENPEKTEKVESDTDEGELLVGCQGLHYYLTDHMEKLVDQKKIPVVLLVPGRLDQFHFKVHFEGEKDDRIHLRLSPSSIFLKILAPSIDVFYDKKTRKLVRYEGPSNIPDENGKIQNVVIEYRYPKP